MLESQTLDVKKVECRAALDAFDTTTGDPDDLLKLTAQYRSLDAQYGSAIVKEAHDAELARRAGDMDVQMRELDGLDSRINFREYVASAVEMRAAGGAEGEYNSGHGLTPRQFPISILAPAQMRATTAVDGQSNQGRWIDRIFSTTAAAMLGVTMEQVAPGYRSFPGYDCRRNRRDAWQESGRCRRCLDNRRSRNEAKARGGLR